MHQWIRHIARVLVTVALALPIVAAPRALVARPILQATDSVVIVAAGDIANCYNEEAHYTAYLVETIGGTVLPLGDLAYEVGSLNEFNACYGPTWGRFKERTRPAPGNHEYGAGNATGYFTYFGDVATPLEPGCTTDCKGYYSYRLGEWLLFALNSEVPNQAGSEQEQWLRAELAANPTRCTLAYWHRPTFTSSGTFGANIDLFRALYDYGADVVLVAHEHNYERFAPQNPSGQLEHERGIRQFVVGTGGAPLHDFRFIQPNSEVRNSETFGVLKMTLHPGSYDWEFIPIDGQSFTDSGSGSCVTAPDVPVPPPPAAAVTTAPAGVTTTAAAPAANTTATLPATGLDYTVQAGDTLSLIAARYGLDWRQVAEVNQLANPSIIEVGQVIRLPGVQAAAASAANTATTAAQPVANVSATTTTTTPVPITAAPATATANAAGRYTVQAGDTLSTIAAQHNVTWQALAAANGLTQADFIQVGQVLTIPGQAASSATTTTTATNVPAATTATTSVVVTATATTPVTATTPATTASAGSPAVHVVASGDTLISIAARYGLDWRQLLELNGLQENSILQIGQQIRLR